MTSISGTSALTASLAANLSGAAQKKTPTREEIFAAQEAKEAAKAAQSGDAKTEFLNFAKMSPAERIRAAYLKEKGLTEDSLAQLSKEEREKIEAEIKKLIKTKLGIDEIGARTGQLADMRV